MSNNIPEYMVQYKQYDGEHNKKIAAEIMAVIDSYTKKMEAYSYFGGNPGVSVDDYEDIAVDIMKRLFGG